MAVSRRMIASFVICSLADMILFPAVIALSIWGYVRVGYFGIAAAVIPAANYGFYVSRFFGIACAGGNTVFRSDERLANGYALKALLVLAWYAALAAMLYYVPAA